jgi:hypothetical protein
MRPSPVSTTEFSQRFIRKKLNIVGLQRKCKFFDGIMTFKVSIFATKMQTIGSKAAKNLPILQNSCKFLD